MLITAKDGRKLGHIFYFKVDPFRKVYEIAYNIFRPADRRQGVMSEALRIFAAYLFEIKALPRLQVLVGVGNVASRRVAERCGFGHEGVLRQYIFMRGKYHDCDVLSVLRSECPSLEETLRA
jgi:RimJ/RimL family protein N-acetyltransferase